LADLIYSGYQPHAYSWDDFPRVKEILDAVRMIEKVFLQIGVEEFLPNQSIKFTSQKSA
jgi:hypothetical protein